MYIINYIYIFMYIYKMILECHTNIDGFHLEWCEKLCQTILDGIVDVQLLREFLSGASQMLAVLIFSNLIY